MPFKIVPLKNFGIHEVNSSSELERDTRNINDILPVQDISANRNRIVRDQHSESFVDPSGKRKVRKNFFPHKLMEILESPFFADCITWRCAGKAFFISDSETFLKKYALITDPLKEALREKSFTRKLNRWGFKKEFTKGPNYGVYSHKYFVRDNPQLCELMACGPSTSSSNGISSEHLIGSRERISNTSIVPREYVRFAAVTSPESILNNRASAQAFTHPRVYDDERGTSHYVLAADMKDPVYSPNPDWLELVVIDNLIQEKLMRIRALQMKNDEH